MIPNDVKDEIKAALKSSVKELIKESPDIKNRLNIMPDSFGISYFLNDNPEYNEFILSNKDLIVKKYNNLVKSAGMSISPQKDSELANSAMGYFLDNFYEYMVYYLAESKNIESDFEIKWQEFNSELFASKNSLHVIAHIKNFYFHGGTDLKTLIPWANTKMYWASSAFEYRLLGWERKGGHHYEFMEKFQPCWILIEESLDIDLPNKIRSNVSDIIDRFNLIMFILRNEIGGNPYFNDVRLFGFGHYSPSGFITPSLINNYDNDIHEEYGKSATLDNPYDYYLGKLFNKVNPNCYKNFEFIDWQLRMINKLELTYEVEYSSKRTRYYLFQQLLNLISILNSLLPDLGDHNNKRNRENFLPVLISNIFKIDGVKITNTIRNVYELRNNIAHGNINEINTIMNSRYSNYNDLKEDLRFMEHIITRIVQLTLANPNFKDLEEAYFANGNSPVLPSLVNPYT